MSLAARRHHIPMPDATRRVQVEWRRARLQEPTAGAELLRSPSSRLGVQPASMTQYGRNAE